MAAIKKTPKVLTISRQHVEEPPKVTFGFEHLHNVSWTDAKDVRFFKDFMLHLQKFSTMTWQAIYSAPRHGLGTETLPVSAVKPQVIGIPTEIQKFLVLRATGDNHPMLGYRDKDTFQVVFLETEFGDVYKH